MSHEHSNGGPRLNLLTATEMAARLSRGETTSVALVEDCLARICNRDPTLRAWTHVDRDLVLAQARARDAEPRRSPLHGVPIGIKDIFDTHDMPTAMARRCSNHIGPPQIPGSCRSCDAPV
jgi:Asp-tRNA(Asn)/Glu-tRNA(Gln) amidotransferase A subunit family amidase